MITISAPHPNNKVTIILPSPKFRNSYTGEGRVYVKRSMLGRTITYVSSNDRQTLVLPLELTRAKSLELKAFIDIYYTATWKLILHDNTIWEVKLTANPFEQVAIGLVSAHNELIAIQLELTGTKL